MKSGAEKLEAALDDLSDYLSELPIYDKSLTPAKIRRRLYGFLHRFDMAQLTIAEEAIKQCKTKKRSKATAAIKRSSR